MLYIYNIEQSNFYMENGVYPISCGINPKTKKPYYNEKILKERRFKEKNICFPEDVYSYIKNIKLSKDNAFIFRKDASLPIIIQKEIKEKLKSR